MPISSPAKTRAAVERLQKSLDGARAKNQALKEALAEARMREKATAQILRVISRNTSDPQPAFEAIVNIGARCFEKCTLSLRLVRENFAEQVATTIARRSSDPSKEPVATGRTMAARAIREHKVIHVGELRRGRGLSKRSHQPGYAAILAVPLMQHGRAVGVLCVTRPTPGQFSSEQVALLKTLAGQALNALRNVRQFEALEIRNSELTQALEQQAATAEILKVIAASPMDTQPVFDAIVNSGVRLFRGTEMSLRLINGEFLERVASSRHPNTPESLRGELRIPVNEPSRANGRAFLSGEVVQLPDMLADDTATPSMLARRRGYNYRAILIAPLLREGVPIGVINVQRAQPGEFTEREVALLQTFASQAVIAIENARLFNELRVRNAELSESLEQQAATAEILKVISLSPTGPQPVFDAIMRSASRLLGGAHVFVRLLEGGQLTTAASTRGPVIDPNPVLLGEAAPGTRSILERRVVHVADIQNEDWIGEWDKERARLTGRRADLRAPMLTDNGAIGTICAWRTTPGYFSHKHVALLQTFAAQAVIAIETANQFREIQQKSRQLEAANEHKSRFLAAASHDLRQPMHALQMFVESLHHEIESPQRARPLIGRLQDSIAVMSGMLDALLDISELETGGTKPTLSSFAANSLLRRIENTFAPIAAEHGLRFKVVSCDAWVRSDPELLARIVENFVSNAVKYTRSGGVVVGCRRRSDALSVEVWDSGMGIPPAHLESIFQEFFQVDNPARDRRKGLGLGLAIADRIARLLDHKIRVRSVQGRGSMFAIDVPYGECTSDVSTPIGMIHEALTQFRGIRVCLVDDEIEILDATKELLERWGCQVIGVRSEAEILEALEHEPGAPNFLICDYQLTGSDNGLSVIRSVRRAYGTSIPAVVISGNTTPELRNAARDAGITLLLKPVAPSRLRQVMQRLVSG